MRIDLSSDATNSYSEYQHSKLPASFLGFIQPLCVQGWRLRPRLITLLCVELETDFWRNAYGQTAILEEMQLQCLLLFTAFCWYPYL